MSRATKQITFLRVCLNLNYYTWFLILGDIPDDTGGVRQGVPDQRGPHWAGGHQLCHQDPLQGVHHHCRR